MSFVNDVDSLLVRAHLSQVPRPVLLGGGMIVLIAIFVLLIQLWGLFFPQGLEVDNAAQITYESHAPGKEENSFESETQDGVKQDLSDVFPTTDKQASGDEFYSTTHEVAQEGSQDLKGDQPLVFVHVAGCVNNPGVYALSEGQRVESAIDAAGGFSDQAALYAVNLARVVQDGEQIYIASQEEFEKGIQPPLTTPSSHEVPSSSPNVVNINTASVGELDSLPGVGPATAQRIVADREQNGTFSTPEDLMRVSGIGEKKFQQLKDFVQV